MPGTTPYNDFAQLLDDEPAIADANPVGCYTCHEPHTAASGDLTRLKTSVLAGDTQSGEFNTCTACHQLNAADGTVLQYAYHDPKVNPEGSRDEIITDNHAAVPGDLRANCAARDASSKCTAAGDFLYFVKKGDPNSCALCHNPHQADPAINRQYAASGHGDATAEPWIHYDWKLSSRASCQRCHTATGFKNYADSLINTTVYNPALNDFSYLCGGAPCGAVTALSRNESLYCWACHTDSKGGLRNPGAFNISALEGANYVTMSNGPITFPDESGSNVCILCHAGRVSGGAIANAVANFSNLSFKNSHYLAAAGILFKTIGYEYSGLDYSNVAYYEHDLIGSAAAPPATGAFGPCAGCHMLNNTAAGVGANKTAHFFSPVTAEGDTITGIATSTCAACHSGEYQMTVAKLTEEEEGYEAALDALQDQAALRNFWWAGCNPYIFKTKADADACNSANAQKNWLSAGDADTTGNTTGKKNMGAAYNLNMLKHEPGAFTHNRIYTRRLIYDSIDWLDNNLIDDSTPATLNALDPATHPYKQKAVEYLLESGGRP